MTTTESKIFFRRQLLAWYKKNKRLLPWKDTRDPYKIWLSEIILQQTRIEQGTPYYLRLIKLFPTIFDLAKCKEDKLLKAWEGLGYYSRARNLHHTAKHIVKERNGKFPERYDDILKLKGVGTYTAAAIASFAFNEPVAVVDGNVFRVLSRFFGVTAPAYSIKGKKKFETLANKLIDRRNPAGFNQAIMDFGATLCKPVSPDCFRCPLRKKCFALKEEKIDNLPVKRKKIKMRKRFFHFIVVRNKKEIYLEKRSGNDIWRGLYQFPLIEKDKFLLPEELRRTPEWDNLFGESKIEIGRSSGEVVQILSHQIIHAKFFEVTGMVLNGHFIVSNPTKLSLFAFPKIIGNYIKNVLH